MTGAWSVVTSLSETNDVSKTGTKDDSVLLDSQWIQFLGPILEVLSQGDPMQRVFGFDYPEYLKIFKESAKDVGLDIVPYQARHSGPSVDIAAGNRTLQEVQKRGNWASKQSVLRYEKAGRLAATWRKLNDQQQVCFKMAERHIAEIILGQPHPHIQLP